MSDMAMTHPDPNDPFDVVQAQDEAVDELQADNAVEADTIQAVSPEGSPE